MNNGTKRDYEKALKFYNNGELDKALECCETGISRDLKNEALLNLKGLLLYLKGDLKEAIVAWKINKDFNDNNMAKSYIKDSEKDKERLKLYNDAQNLAKDLDIDNAIDKLMICSESDFNAIQVNNALAICFMRKGDYDRSKFYLEKARTINKNDITVKSISKELDIFEKNNNGILKFMIVPIAIIMATVMIFINRDTIKNIKFQQEYVQEAINVEDEYAVLNSYKNYGKENIDIKESKTDIEKDNNEKEEKKYEEKLTFKDVQERYITATTYFEEEKYSNAKSLLQSILNESKGTHLEDDILFLLASTEYNSDNQNQAIKYFEDYISYYKNGDYIEEVYYKLILLYRDKDIIKGKEYANRLVNEYPNSIYNNSNVDSVLKR